MITIISGTNRPGSRTLLFATHYAALLRDMGQVCQLLDLAEVPLELFVREMYDPRQMPPQLIELQERFVLGVDKFVFFVPEYNGSYPGVLKLFIDGISVNQYGKNFKAKYAALVGVSSGRAGNLRGMDHLGASLGHMGTWILPNQIPLSSIESLLTDNVLTDEGTISSLKTQAQQLIAA